MGDAALLHHGAQVAPLKRRIVRLDHQVDTGDDAGPHQVGLARHAIFDARQVLEVQQDERLVP